MTPARLIRGWATAAGAVPSQGMVGGEVATIPFFADPANHADPRNVTTLRGGGATEVVTISDAAGLQPRCRPAQTCCGDGTSVWWPRSTMCQARSLLGATPSNNGPAFAAQLAIQRIRQTPADRRAHTVAHTFELKPSLVPLRVGPPWRLRIRVGLSQRVRACRTSCSSGGTACRVIRSRRSICGGRRRRPSGVAGASGGAGSMTASATTTRSSCALADATYVPLPVIAQRILPGLLT